MKKKMLILLSMVGLFIIMLFFSDTTVALEYIGITNITVTDKNIMIAGYVGDPGYSGPSIAYSGYTAEYRNGNLFVKFKSRDAILSNGFSDFNISIPNKYNGIKAVYLWRGNQTEKIMIWPENKTLNNKSENSAISTIEQKLPE
jgi:hypothetical protein